MDNKNSNKIVVVISVLAILGTLCFGLIYNKTYIKDNTYNDFKEYFHDYNVNEVQRIYVSLEEIANKYLADTVSNIIYYPKDVYSNLDDKTKENYKTYDEFSYMLSRIKTVKFLNAKVKSYSSGVIDGKRAIYVMDEDDNKFIFIENSINNYKVRIN